MYFVAYPEKPAEAHDERTPLYGIDMRVWPLINQQKFIDMQLYDVYFEAVGGDVLSERPPIVNDPFHLDGTLRNAGRQNFCRGYRREPGNAELIRFVAIAPA